MGWTRAQMFMDRPTLEASGSNLLDRGDLPVIFHEGDWLGYKAMAFRRGRSFISGKGFSPAKAAPNLKQSPAMQT